MQLVFVEMNSSTIYASSDTAWLANYLAKQSRQTRLTEIIHNTKKTWTTKPNKTKLALVQSASYDIRPGNGVDLFYTVFRKKHQLLFSCVTLRKSNQFEWKFQCQRVIIQNNNNNNNQALCLQLHETSWTNSSWLNRGVSDNQVSGTRTHVSNCHSQ